MTLLTEKQAYAAMFRFLDQLYLRTKPDGLGGWLGAMSLLPDGSTSDAAMDHDWRKAIKFVMNGGEAGKLELNR
jgi:hypothetical protein